MHGLKLVVKEEALPLKEPHAPFSSTCAASSSCPCCLPLGPPCLYLLLASACCLPPRSCSFFGLFCPLRCLCVFWCVVCSPFLVWPLVVSVSFVLVCLLLVCSSRFVVWFVGCACCQLTKVTKTAEDCRPQHHTHTHPPQWFPPARHIWRLICPAALSPRPTGTSVLLCKGSRI